MQFSNFEQLRGHILQIEIGNHSPTKRWDAAQNFYHLAGAIEGSMKQLPAGYPFLVRLVIRPFRWIVTRYRFLPWMPIPAAIRYKLDPPKELDFSEQKDRLLSAIDSFQQFRDAHPPHPVLGRLSRDEWIGFHLRHCEHHLSFIRINE